MELGRGVAEAPKPDKRTVTLNALALQQDGAATREEAAAPIEREVLEIPAVALPARVAVQPGDYDKYSATIVMIGNRGSGKYSLFNSFLMGVIGGVADYNKASKDAASQQNQNASHKGRFLGEEGSIHMVNTAGVREADNADSACV